MPKKFRRTIQNSLIAIGGVLAALLLLEIGARFLPTPYDGSSNPADTASPFTGWRGKPHFHTTVETQGYYHELTLNSRGMHDTEHPLDKPPGVYRILMLGDSFVQAVQVKEEETAHQVLEDLLNSQNNGQQYEVISAGVGGWGTGQQLMYYRTEGRRYRPDMVLLMFFLGNDVKDNLPGRGVTVDGLNSYAPYFTLAGRGLDPAPWYFAPGLPPAMGSAPPGWKPVNNFLGRLYQHSRLYRQIEPLVARAPEQPSMLDFYLGHNPTFDYAFELTLALVEQLGLEVAQDGAQFRVALISPVDLLQFSQMTPDEREAIYRKMPGLRRAEEIDPPNRRIADRLSQKQIEVLDLFPPFLEHYQQADTPLYFEGDKHWTPAGNRLAGETLFEWLRR
ncbi:MAG: hypothetical protein D6784_06510 [Chloroflexi bacterium]|nr:MAG: hypothetical protein D6784_06510 [Chloroflexota bacterium]